MLENVRKFCKLLKNIIKCPKSTAGLLNHGIASEIVGVKSEIVDVASEIVYVASEIECRVGKYGNLSEND